MFIVKAYIVKIIFSSVFGVVWQVLKLCDWPVKFFLLIQIIRFLPWKCTNSVSVRTWAAFRTEFAKLWLHRNTWQCVKLCDMLQDVATFQLRVSLEKFPWAQNGATIFFTFLCPTIEILIGACGYHDAGSVRHANMLSSGSWVLIKKCKKVLCFNIVCACWQVEVLNSLIM